MRSREGAPVAVPVEWDEVAALKAANSFSLSGAAERAQDEMAWARYFKLRRSLADKMLHSVGAEADE
ncbi:MAG: hypothetical protein ABS75_16415 [Pelagibacterium sp. SCN 63-23]|nr:MAG: hypothetical protein ABS75_16415 [Pelagibacterium sp. SCN 63-23]